jgi:subtilase family serine protease
MPHERLTSRWLRVAAIAMAAPVSILAGCAGGSAPVPLGADGAAPLAAASMRSGSMSAAPRRVCEEPAAAGTARCYVLVGPPRETLAISPDTAGFYSPSQLQAAYDLPSAKKGVGETVAIVDAYDDPNVEADLGVYRSNYGLSACTTANGCFKKMNQMGEPSPLPTGDQSWGFEMSLDTQMVAAICPNCKIRLIEANSSNLSDLETGVDTAVGLGLHFVSTSWGAGEFASETSDDVNFDHPGVVITNSSGDGAYSGGTQYPASSPYVTAVGGTTLVPASNTRKWFESAWGPSTTQGSGSGCSLYEAKPTWQLDTGCTNRTTADVAAVADSVAGYDSDTSQPGWYSFYGTSVSSPIIASVYALADNAKSTNFGSYPYAHTSSLYDIKKGSTGTCSPAYLCTAEPGYDGPTGNGTPHGIGGF